MIPFCHLRKNFCCRLRLMVCYYSQVDWKNFLLNSCTLYYSLSWVLWSLETKKKFSQWSYNRSLRFPTPTAQWEIEEILKYSNAGKVNFSMTKVPFFSESCNTVLSILWVILGPQRPSRFLIDEEEDEGWRMELLLFKNF